MTGFVGFELVLAHLHPNAAIAGFAIRDHATIAVGRDFVIGRGSTCDWVVNCQSPVLGGRQSAWIRWSGRRCSVHHNVSNALHHVRRGHETIVLDGVKRSASRLLFGDTLELLGTDGSVVVACEVREIPGTTDPDNMMTSIAPRTVILGNSGSGKSTRARELAEELACPHLDLDTIAWEPGQIAVERRRDLAMRDVEAFCAAHDRWVVEGCYGDLAEVALRFDPELVVLDPGVETCLAHANLRPWEPHKYASKAEQDERLPMLRTWIRAYYDREGTCSLAEHRDVFDRYTGTKRWLTDLG